jgi:hypothetical protein
MNDRTKIQLEIVPLHKSNENDRKKFARMANQVRNQSVFFIATIDLDFEFESCGLAVFSNFFSL